MKKTKIVEEINDPALEGLSYEEALTKIEELLEKLEAGDIPLEKALEVYQQGVTLLAHCSKIINKVEEKLTVLKMDKGEE